MKYAAKKIVWMLLTMVIVSFLAFLAFRHHSRRPRRQAAGRPRPPRSGWRPCGRSWGWTARFWSGYGQWLAGFRYRGHGLRPTTTVMPVSQMLQAENTA